MPTLPCRDCKKPVETRFADWPSDERTGRWIEYSCSCGAHYYICERDYRRWEEIQAKRG